MTPGEKLKREFMEGDVHLSVTKLSRLKVLNDASDKFYGIADKSSWRHNEKKRVRYSKVELEVFKAKLKQEIYVTMTDLEKKKKK